MKINKSIQFLGRLVIAIIVLGITAFFCPGFDKSNFLTLSIITMTLTTFDFILGCYTKLFFHPYLKLLTGFVLSGIALYIVQNLTIGYIISIISIMLGAIVYGLVDYMLPNEEINGRNESSLS